MLESALEASIAEAGYPNGFRIAGVKLELKAGEMLLVTGRSGSGKSTLLKSLTGLIRVSGGFVEGSVKVLGEEVLDKPLEEVLRRVFYIPQEPWFGVAGYTVQAEYCHALSIYGVECSVEKLAAYGLEGYSSRVTYGLSAGEYQRLLWAEALEARTPLVFMDEPFTYVDASGREVLRKYVEELLESGGSAVIVDHIPSNWRDYEPLVLVLERGKPAYYGRYREDLVEAPASTVKRRASKDSSESRVMLQAVNVWFKYPASPPVLKGVSLEVREGEVIGLRGANGAGKTTLLKVLSGIYNPWRGLVHRYKPTAYIPENPLLYFTHPTPREEIYGCARDAAWASRVVEALGLEDLLDRPLARLSTGERRRAALASALSSKYEIILLDEPTGGLDRYSVESFIEVVFKAVEYGAAVVIAHHDPRLDGLFDHECLLEGGVLRCLY